MTWRRVVPAALLAGAIGCGDDGSPSDPTDGMNTPTETGTAPGEPTTDDPTSGPATPAGTSTGTPGTTDGTTAADDTGTDSSGSVVPCEYPAGAVEPMAINEVLAPYSWPTALHSDGTETVLDLADAPCGLDDVIDWSPHDVLVFISIPAW